MKIRILIVLALAATLPAQGSPTNESPEVVRKAQQALAAQGYDPGPIDGQWRQQTEQALKQAQKDREFEPSGQLDQRTFAALGVSDAENPFMREPSASTGGTRPGSEGPASPAPSQAAPSSR